MSDSTTNLIESWLDLGQRYAALKDHEKALEAYSECLRLGARDEAEWCATWGSAQCGKHLGSEADYVKSILAAYDMRPHRVEPLLSFSAHLRERGQHHFGMLIAKKARTIPLPKSDRLCVDPDTYSYGADKEFYVHAFFAGSPDDRRTAATLCQQTAIDRNAPENARRTARHNTLFFAANLAATVPSFTPRKIATQPSLYPAMNPSIAVWRGSVWLCVRRVSYQIGDGCDYTITPSGNVIERQENHQHISQVEITALDGDLHSTQWRTVVPSPAPPFPLVRNRGLEDMRLNPRDDGLWFSATCCEMHPKGTGKMLVGRLNEDPSGGHALAEWDTASRAGQDNRWEKNWMPFVGTDRFLYSVDPTVVISQTGKQIQSVKPEMALDHLRGGTQLIPFQAGAISGWLGIAHESTVIGENRHYLHRFILVDETGNVRRVSRAFCFGSGERIEFAAGLCQLPQDGKLAITYGVMDREAWLATADADEIAAMLTESFGGSAAQSP